jgi:hypothetical protein
VAEQLVASQVGLSFMDLVSVSRSVLGSIHSPIQRERGALSPGVKRPGREADHSIPASAEVKKVWIYTSTLPYIFVA